MTTSTPSVNGLPGLPYKELPTKPVTLGNRQPPNGYVEPERAYHLVPEVY